MIYFRYEQPRIMRLQKTKEIMKSTATIILFTGIFIGTLVVLAWLV